MAGRRVEGGCEYVTSETRLGSSWSLCNRPAKWRCTIAHGDEERVEDYCQRHYAAALRRTRYDKVLAAEPIDGGRA